MNVSFCLDIDPPTTTDQHKGVRVIRNKSTGKTIVMHYVKKQQQLVHEMYNKLITESIKAFDKSVQDYLPFSSPVSLSIKYMFPWGKSVSKARAKTVEPKLTRPDLDNMSKGLIDCMTKSGLLKDDSYVYSLSMSKHYSPIELRGIYISIDTLTQI